MLDDLAITGSHHYPCIIYLREGGEPIGEVGPRMMANRRAWYRQHNCQLDEICAANCLDVCVAYNKKHEEYRS